ncbi:hypothetical protein X474_15945 [Dethiosulfatarculus sandiegensis]|uniref:Uncharacterized protein n=1 Tax=Dethiosulfatarculus sandiegensis TaxID=1429043 RepID=A0A0D2JBF2_9BACT|nr:hypothetical protein X474_15945 [Dethiosulfatarculus sandiegensis]
MSLAVSPFLDACLDEALCLAVGAGRIWPRGHMLGLDVVHSCLEQVREHQSISAINLLMATPCLWNQAAARIRKQMALVAFSSGSTSVQAVRLLSSTQTCGYSQPDLRLLPERSPVMQCPTPSIFPNLFDIKMDHVAWSFVLAQQESVHPDQTTYSSPKPQFKTNRGKRQGKKIGNGCPGHPQAPHSRDGGNLLNRHPLGAVYRL